MSTQLIAVSPTQVMEPEWARGQEKLDLLKRTICKDATNDELQLFIHVAKRSGLDPFAKQIHAVKRQGKMTIQVGIDGFRLIADRTGAYAGSDEPLFDNEKKPTRATVTVYKMVGGVRCPFTATARWDEYFPGAPQDFMWKKMPCTMIAKCAEALALRKAFPAELSSLYAPEEMDQADKDLPRVVPQQPEIGDGSTTVHPDMFTSGQHAGRKYHELKDWELRAWLTRTELKQGLGPSDLRMIDKVKGYLETLAQMGPDEPGSDASEEPATPEKPRCVCGGNFVLSKNKPVYYCEKWKDTAVAHSRNMTKETYDSA